MTKPMESFDELDLSAVINVANALGSGQNVGEKIEGCSIKDVRHVVALLAHVAVLEELRPGFFCSMLKTVMPVFVKQSSRLKVEAGYQRTADRMGYGAEMAAVIQASRSPGKKGLKPAVVKVAQAAMNVDEKTAVDEVAELFGVDPESLQRSMRRHKKKT